MNELEKLSLLTEVLVGTPDTVATSQESEVISEEGVKEVPHGYFYSAIRNHLSEFRKQMLELSQDFIKVHTRWRKIKLETREADSNHIDLVGKILFDLNVQKCYDFNESKVATEMKFNVILHVEFQKVPYVNTVVVHMRTNVTPTRTAHIKSFECVDKKTQSVIISKPDLDDAIV